MLPGLYFTVVNGRLTPTHRLFPVQGMPGSMENPDCREMPSHQLQCLCKYVRLSCSL